MYTSHNDSWLVGANGVYRGSPVDGWTRIGEFDFHANVLLPSSDGRDIFAGVNCGLFRISVETGSWRQLHDETVTEVLALADAAGASASQSPVLIGCPYGVAHGSVDELDAMRWEFLNDGLRVNERFTNVLVGVKDTSRYLVGTEAGIIVIETGGALRVERTSLTGFPVRAIIASGDGYFAGTDGHGIWRSGDGLAWEPAGYGIDEVTVLSLAAESDRIIAGTEGGVLVGSGSDSWRRVGPSVLVAAVAVDPANRGRWLIGCKPSGLWWSDDNGEIWRQSGAFTAVGAIVREGGAA